MENTTKIPTIGRSGLRFDDEPWRRLVAVSRPVRMQAAGAGGGPVPEDFAAVVVAAWLRVAAPIPSARAVTAGDAFDLWEVLGLRAAVVAVAAVAIVGCLNFGSLREEWNGDSLNLDPTASIFGLSL